MATTANGDTCAVTMPTGRRFYVHVGSLGFLVAAQPSMFDEVATALALSGASRALDQAVEDWAMFSSAGPSQDLNTAAEQLHDHAADALRLAFQCMVHLIPPRFGATDLLLGASEQINAWCFEDDYLTYATDEDAAAIMYAETGSLRQLRSELRRSPDYDPSLQMISGQSMFLFDGNAGTGNGTAQFYKKQAARLLRSYRPSAVPQGIDDDALAKVMESYVGRRATTFDGDLVFEQCMRRARVMVELLVRNLPPAPAMPVTRPEPGKVPAGAGVH